MSVVVDTCVVFVRSSSNENGGDVTGGLVSSWAARVGVSIDACWRSHQCRDVSTNPSAVLGVRPTCNSITFMRLDHVPNQVDVLREQEGFYATAYTTIDQICRHTAQPLGMPHYAFVMAVAFKGSCASL